MNHCTRGNSVDGNNGSEDQERRKDMLLTSLQPYLLMLD